MFNAAITSSGTVTAQDSSGMAIGSVTAVPSGTTVVVTLTGVPEKSRVRISLAAVNGGATPVSASMGFLMGDVNGTRSITASDVSGVKARAGQVADSTNFRYDVNASGGITAADISAVKARSGSQLPP